MQPPVLIQRKCVRTLKGKETAFVWTQAKQSPSPFLSPARLIGVIDLSLQHKVEGKLLDTASLAARSNWSAT